MFARVPGRALFAVLLTSLASTSAPPAHAVGASIYLMQGSGTISPGLGLTPGPQSVTFDGTASYLSTFPIGFGSYTCHFDGTSTGSAAASVGTLEGQCGPATYVNIAFGQVGLYVTMDAVVVGGTSRSFHADCIFTSRDTNPTTAYDLTCAVDVDVTSS